MRLKSIPLQIILGVALAYGLGAIFFPERFWQFNVTFVDYTDSMLSYAGAFFITNGLFHGGINLWDRYDQMPATFFHLNFAMYKFSNALTALCYVPLSWFADNQSQLFHQLFTFIFITSTMVIRMVGIWALFGLFLEHQGVRVFATAYASVIYAPQFMMGLSTNIIYALFPLMMFFWLKFIQTRRWQDLGFLILIWLYCVGSDLFCGLGYLYQALHFLIVPGCVMMGWVSGWTWKGLLAWCQSALRDMGASSCQRVKILWVIGALLLMIGTNAALVKWHYQDYEFGLDQSRMKDPLSVSAYFKRPAAWAPQEGILKRSLDFTENLWSLDWVYQGPLFLCLAMIGAVVLRDRRKWVLLACAGLYVLINSPRDAAGLSALAHWINALSNPFKFLPRSMHMSCALLLPFILMPLMAVGLQYLWSLKSARGKFVPGIIAAMWLMVVMAVLGWMQLPPAAAMVTAATVLALLVIILSGVLLKLYYVRAIVVIALLGGVLLADGWSMSQYVRGLLSTVLIKPRPVLADEGVVPGILDYQNPVIMPYAAHFSLTRHTREDTYLSEAGANAPGMVFRYVNMMRYYQPISNYLPRHKSFGSWFNDQGLMYVYLNAVQRSMVFVPFDLSSQKVSVVDLINQGLVYTAVVIDDPQGVRPAITQALIDGRRGMQALLPVKEVIDLKPALWRRQGALMVAAVGLPAALPSSLATSVLTPDGHLMSLEGIVEGNPVAFKPAQGAVTMPWTYDINNRQEGKLTLAIPVSAVAPTQVVLQYLTDGVFNVGRISHDALSVTVNAPGRGWVVFHEPYDPRWQVTIDGKRVPFYKANNSFIAVAVNAGEQQVSLAYMPGSWLRWAVAFSALAGLILLPWLLMRVFKGTQEDRV